MKNTKTIVIVIIAAAVLIAAYAIGLFIRYARSQRETPEAAMTPQALVDQQAPGGGAGRKTRTDTRPQKEKLIQKMNNMTEEERRQFTEEQVLKRVSARNSRRQDGELSAGEPKRALQGTAQPQNDGSEPNEAGQE